MNGLRCTADHGYPVEVVHLTGRLDAATVADLRAAVLDCLADEPDVLVIDVHGLTVTDGYEGAFAALAGQAQTWPGTVLVLAHASPRLTAAVRRCGADLASYPSVRTAREAQSPEHAPSRIRETLPAATVAAPLARRVVDQACRAWALPDLSDPAQLIVTELVANAVRHAGTLMTLTVSVHGRHLQISVIDHDPRPPQPNSANPVDEHGRGLQMIEALGSDWGTVAVRDGKVVWARVAVPSANQRRIDRQIARPGGV